MVNFDTREGIMKTISHYNFKHDKSTILDQKLIRNRTKYTPNEFFIEGKLCKIQLYDLLGKSTEVALIDTKNAERCKTRKWRTWSDRNGKHKCVISSSPFFIRLHRFILKLNKDDLGVDHINRDSLDCREINLRLATNSENLSNRPKNITNTSGGKNIVWHKINKKWRVIVTKHYCHHDGGCYASFKDAIKARNKLLIKLHGEFAYLD